MDPDLWHFPFQLEPLTKLSLAKYVLAETPSEDVLVSLGLTDEIDAIKKTLKIGGNLTVHRVGLIYDQINGLFSIAPMKQGPSAPPYTDDHPFIAAADIRTRLLRRMSGVEASIGKGVQNAGAEDSTGSKTGVRRSQRISARWLRRTRTLCHSLYTRSLKMRTCIASGLPPDSSLVASIRNPPRLAATILRLNRPDA